MKKCLLLLVATLRLLFHSFATVHTVMVGDYSFTPSSVTMYLGDTILWAWSNGTHTTTSIAIPRGAMAWNSGINPGITSFMYVPTVAGIYNYECTIHAAMGMTGILTVANNTGINEASNITTIISVYPNPVSTLLHVKFNFENNLSGLPVSVLVTDMNGRSVIKKKYKVFNDAGIDLQDVPNGNYILYAKQGSDVYHQQLVIAH